MRRANTVAAEETPERPRKETHEDSQEQPTPMLRRGSFHGDVKTETTKSVTPSTLRARNNAVYSPGKWIDLFRKRVG
jgi:hypothetical protein